MRGRYKDAKQALYKIYPKEFDHDGLIEEIGSSLKLEETIDRHAGWKALLCPSPAVKRMLLVGVGTAIFQSLTGIDIVEYYLIIILDDAGINGESLQAKYLILIGLVKVICVFLSSKLSDTQGRRPLLLTSLCGQCIAYLVVFWSFSSEHHHHQSQFRTMITLGGFLFYEPSFSLGLESVGCVVPSEVFFTSVRSKANSLAGGANRLVSSVMTISVLSIVNAIGWNYYFLGLSVLCFVGVIFFYIYLPETKGKSLEEMVELFATITNDKTVFEMEKELKFKSSI